jgi:hypothetical protein
LSSQRQFEANMQSHESPVKQIKTVSSSFNNGKLNDPRHTVNREVMCLRVSSVAAGPGAMDTSPMLQWSASPLYQFDCFSPGEASNMSFTMTSPPCHIPTYESESAHHGDITAFSPSIFSPKEGKIGSRLPKKRELYGVPGSSSSAQLRGGIADTADKESPGGSRGSMDLSGALAL